MKDKLIGTAYVNIIKDSEGKIKFAYGYELNEKEISMNDLGMLNSFLGKLKTKAQQDFEERLDINDKEFSIEKDGVVMQ
jgi:hypothetical protein